MFPLTGTAWLERTVTALKKSCERSAEKRTEQYGIENNFSFLKDDQIVNAIFLKRPERIEALGLILLIARLHNILIFLTLSSLITGCKLQVIVSSGGYVNSLSGTRDALHTRLLSKH